MLAFYTQSIFSKQQSLSRPSHWPLFAVVCSDSTVAMVSMIIPRDNNNNSHLK